MVFDSRRQVCVLFGGADEQGNGSQKTWEWDGVHWQWRATNGAPPSEFAAMAYDRIRGRTVLFGGLACGLCGPNTTYTWEWDGTNWELAATSGPSRRYSHGMAFDERRGRVVLFGGLDDRGDDLGDTWLWDGQVWTQANVTGPTARDGFGMAWDADRGTIVLFGGEGASYLSDTWEWNGSTWTPRLALVPSGRTADGFAYDRYHRQFVLHGGRDTPGGIQETWLLKFVETWVDYAFIGVPAGTFAQPFPSLAVATNAAPAGSDITFKPGTGSETITVRKALTLRAPLGDVIIRSP